MQYNPFPATGRSISRLGYGAMGLGGAFGTFDEAEGIRSVLMALERGVNFIDTARHYGQSEEILGKALAQWQGESPFLATKIQSHGPDNTRWCIPQDVETTYPRHLIRQNTEESLRRMGVDHIDLMQLHLYWPNWGTSGYWLDELMTLKEEGKIGAIGVSLPDHRADVGLPLILSGAIDSVQLVLNIFDPQALDSVVPLCQQNNVAVIARCVLDEGGLSGFLTEDRQFEAHDFRKTFFEEVPRRTYMDRVDGLRQYVPQYASSLAGLALKFVLAHPGVTTAITSMHIEAHVDDNVRALTEAPLPPDVFLDIRQHHRWVRNFYDKKYWQGVNDLDAANDVEASK
jgi:methylglyoxal reductase